MSTKNSLHELIVDAIELTALNHKSSAPVDNTEEICQVMK